MFKLKFYTNILITQSDVQINKYEHVFVITNNSYLYTNIMLLV